MLCAKYNGHWQEITFPFSLPFTQKRAGEGGFCGENNWEQATDDNRGISPFPCSMLDIVIKHLTISSQGPKGFFSSKFIWDFLAGKQWINKTVWQVKSVFLLCSFLAFWYNSPQSAAHEGAPGLQVPTKKETKAAAEEGTQPVRKIHNLISFRKYLSFWWELWKWQGQGQPWQR